MDKDSSANSQNPSLRPNNPFANLPNTSNSATGSQGIASSDSQLEELRRRVDESAYANSAYDRANAFSVTNTREQPNIGVGGSATAYGGIKDSDLEFLSVAANEPEEVIAPDPIPAPEPILPPQPTMEARPIPQPAPAPAPQPAPAPRPQQQFISPAQQQQPVYQPAPQPMKAAPAEKKEKGGLSLPLIIVIAIVAIALIGLAIWAILALKNRGTGGVNEKEPQPEPPAPTEVTVDYQEYNRRIDAKEAVNCTATYDNAVYTGRGYDEGNYEIFSEKSWTIAADEGWKHVYVSNYDFRFNLADGSVLASNNLRQSPASIYFDDTDAYLWSVTLTTRAGGDGSSKYRLASYETVAPSLKLSRSDVESSFTKDFYETVKVSSEEINDAETGKITFTCKTEAGLSEYQEFLDTRKAEIGSNNAN